jgi:hypothetical protein
VHQSERAARTAAKALHSVTMSESVLLSMQDWKHALAFQLAGLHVPLSFIYDWLRDTAATLSLTVLQ